MNRTDITTTTYFHDCCLDPTCPGHEGWVTCDSFPADARMVADILDASADFDRMTRHLSRFGTSAIADDEIIASLSEARLAELIASADDYKVIAARHVASFNLSDAHPDGI